MPPVLDSSPLLLGRVSLLRQALAQQFSHRPTLRSVVADLLITALKTIISRLNPPHDVSRLYIVWTADESLVKPRYRLLLDAMLEHIAVGTPMHYGYYEPEQCYLAWLADGTAPPDGWQSLAPMREVEVPMRDIQRDWTGAFQQALVDYWNQPLVGHRSRLHGFRDFLGDNLRASANTTPALDDQQVKALRQVLDRPVLSDRLQRFGANGQPRVYFAQFQSSGGVHGDEHLLAEALVVHVNNGTEHVLQCKPSGQIQAFASLNEFASAMGRTLSRRHTMDAVIWKRYEPVVDFLQVQAMIVLNTQLDEIAAIRQAVPESARTLLALERQLLAITDPCSIFDDLQPESSEQLGQVFKALPDWLKNASLADRVAYRRHVIELADTTRNAQGRMFNEDIPDIHTYASQVLHAQMLKDQPLAPGYDPDEIELEFTVASGPFGTIGMIQTYTFSLTELAVQNLIAMPSGRMTIRHTRDQLIQDWWMTPSYIKSLIHRVDIGGNYPELIKRLLVDDVEEAQRREALYVDQLRVALPMLALELKLRGQGAISQWGYRCVAALMQRDPAARVLDGQSVGIRPLAFLRAPGATPDFVRSQFVIGSTNSLHGPCVLYRPLFKDMLIEYASASALVDAIVREGPVRNSVLEWLPSAVKSTYEHILLHPTNLLIAAPSASSDVLFVQPLSTRFEHDLFRESAMALALLADRQSVSNAESRWATLKEGGWLLFNTLLPLIRGPIGVFGWLYMTVSTLKNDIEVLRGDDERAKAAAIVDVLFNIAAVLLHAANAVQPPPLALDDAVLARPLVEHESGNTVLSVAQGQVYFPGVPLGNQDRGLDFSWFNNPRIDFSQTQLTWLDHNGGQSLENLKPLSHGPYKGLYVANKKWHALVRGFSYQVSQEDDGVVVVSPHDELDTGPWLRRNEEGAWDFDTRLRLRGGGPKKAQEKRARLAQRKARISELDAKFQALQLREPQLAQYIAGERLKVYEVTQGEADQSFSYQERTRRLTFFRSLIERTSAEYVTELNYFNERYGLQPRSNDHLLARNFYSVLFNYSVDLLYAQSMLTEGLKELYPEFIEMEQAIAPSDVEQYVTFKREMLNSQQLFFGYFKAQADYLNQLQHVPRVGEKLARALEQQRPTIGSSAEGDQRYTTDIDFLNMQLGLLMDLAPKNLFSEEWDSLASIIVPLTYTAKSHAELIDTELFTHSERIEIMEDMAQRYARAQDALAILHLEVGDQFNPDDYQQLTEAVDALSARLERQLAEEVRQQNEWLPEQPGPSRRPSASKRIIRTRKQGILIGVARARASDQEPLVVDVGGSAASESSQQPISPVSNMPVLTFKQSGTDQWEAIEQRPMAPAVTRSLEAIKKQCNTLLGKVDEKIRRVKGYSKNSRFALELEETLDREAQKLERLIVEIEGNFKVVQVLEKPKPGTPQSLIKRLHEGASKLREQAIWILKSLPPTESTVEFLLGKGEVHLARIGPRIKMKGERQDFVQEYEVRDKKNQVLWYAHLHYKTLTDPANTPSAAHFKLKAQRMASPQTLQAKAKPGAAVEVVHYGKISPKMFGERFLTLDA